MIDSAFRTGKVYYPEVFLEECKYVVKGRKMPKYTIKDIEISSDESDRENSEEETFDKENSNEESSDEESLLRVPYLKMYFFRKQFL